MKTKKETRGRKTVLDATLTKRICELLAKGSSIKSACLQLGISEASYHNWQERGKGGEEPYTSFFVRASRARETHKQNLIEIVRRAADKDAKHAEWLLERQFPKHFGRSEPRMIIMRSEPPLLPPLEQERKNEWRDDGVLPESFKSLEKYLGLLQGNRT